MLSDDVPAAIAGDRGAFARVVARHHTLVWSVAVSVLADAAASEEVAQEVFTAAWTHRASLRDPARFTAWLRRTARNRALQYLRARRRRARTLEEAPTAIAAPLDGLATLEHAERVAALSRALARLPEDARLVLVLFYVEGQSTADVARALGISEAAVRQRLSRARARLRDDLDEHLGVLALLALLPAARRDAPRVGAAVGLVAAGLVALWLWAPSFPPPPGGVVAAHAAPAPRVLAPAFGRAPAAEPTSEPPIPTPPAPSPPAPLPSGPPLAAAPAPAPAVGPVAASDPPAMCDALASLGGSPRRREVREALSAAPELSAADLACLRSRGAASQVIRAAQDALLDRHGLAGLPHDPVTVRVVLADAPFVRWPSAVWTLRSGSSAVFAGVEPVPLEALAEAARAVHAALGRRGIPARVAAARVPLEGSVGRAWPSPLRSSCPEGEEQTRWDQNQYPKTPRRVLEIADATQHPPTNRTLGAAFRAWRVTPGPGCAQQTVHSTHAIAPGAHAVLWVTVSDGLEAALRGRPPATLLAAARHGSDLRAVVADAVGETVWRALLDQRLAAVVQFSTLEPASLEASKI